MQERTEFKMQKLKDQVSVRLPEDLLSTIRVEAANQDRTVAGLIRRTLNNKFGQKRR